MKTKMFQRVNRQSIGQRILLLSITMSVWIFGMITLSQVSQTAKPEPQATISSQSGGNILRNASFEEGFYWNYPNHYVAEEWNRWWKDGSNLPEYTDSSAHSTRPHFDGKRAQAWHIWGRTYTAGIYQVAHHATPCTMYELSAWVQSHSLNDAHPHARVGLDPKGTQLTSSPSSGAVANLPPDTVWSREQSVLYMWENLSVTAEAYGEDVTAIFYTAPKRGSKDSTYFFDSMWDAAALIQVPFPGGRLPTPDAPGNSGVIYNLTTDIQLNTLVIEWDTLEPASTQVLYDMVATDLITTSIPHSYTVYIPIVSRKPADPFAYARQTPIDTDPVVHHRAVIGNLQDESEITIEYVTLSRYIGDSECITEMSTPKTITFKIPKLYQTYLPLVTGSDNSGGAQTYGR